ncbi:hypothetical protein DRO64_03445 [Candidatus Bathyarchaeota archaeon]|nr:MAG: hypothetical protein DRO64_03445 [Candidatus Bathyarchaeota archaeon]
MSASTASTLVLIAFILAILVTIGSGLMGALQLIGVLVATATGIPVIYRLAPLVSGIVLVTMFVISVFVTIRTYRARNSIECGNIPHALRLLSVPFCVIATIFSGLATGILLFIARSELSRIQAYPSRGIYAERITEPQGEEIEW